MPASTQCWDSASTNLYPSSKRFSRLYMQISTFLYDPSRQQPAEGDVADDHDRYGNDIKYVDISEVTPSWICKRMQLTFSEGSVQCSTPTGPACNIVHF